MTRVRKEDNGGDVRRVTWVGLGWNAALSVGKFFAGYFGGSQALVADAIHSASDFITDIAIIVTDGTSLDDEASWAVSLKQANVPFVAVLNKVDLMNEVPTTTACSRSPNGSQPSWPPFP